MLDLALYLVLGGVLGTLGGLFGIGGGLIAIPVLGVFFGLDQQIAQGTALVMVVPNVMLALWRVCSSVGDRRPSFLRRDRSFVPSHARTHVHTPTTTTPTPPTHAHEHTTTVYNTHGDTE